MRLKRALVIYLAVIVAMTTAFVVYAQQISPGKSLTQVPLRVPIRLQNENGHLRVDVSELEWSTIGLDGRTYRVRVEKRKFQR